MLKPYFKIEYKERLKGDKRFPFGLPKADNANYLWIQMFYSALKTPKYGENYIIVPVFA